MDAEIIAIGDELSSGQRLDTNSQWLARELGTLGIHTVQHTVVGDDLARNVDAMQRAATRAEIVVCTGGLGPTLDDLTRQAMADAFELDLELHEPSLEHIQTLFASRKREMPERNRIQAMFPAGSQVIPNPHGSAPGIDLTIAGEEQGGVVRFFALPGVPAEMKEMWHASVAKRIDSMLDNQDGTLRYHEVKVFGIGESDVEVKLPDLIRRDRSPTVGITVSRATITLRLAGRAGSQADFDALIQPSLEEIHSALGDLVYGAGSDDLQDIVARLLSKRQLSFSCIELGCASWVGDWMLGLQQQSSATEFTSHAFPSIELAKRWLGTEISEQAPLESLTRAFSLELKQKLSTDVVLLIASYPSHAEIAQAKGPFEQFYGVVIADEFHGKQTRMGGHPDVLGPRIAKSGLDFLRRILLGLPTT